MILNNFRTWRSYTMSHNLLQGRTGTDFVNIGLVDMSRNTGWKFACSTYVDGTNANWTFNSPSSYIGSGTTEPTEMDYTLATDETSKFSNIQRTTNISADGGSWLLVHTISGVNVSGSDVTISEIGLTIKLTVSNDVVTQVVEFMLVRALLDQPLVVPAGKGFSLTFQWRGV